MKKSLLSVFSLFFYTLILIAQTAPLSEVELPDFTPPSPQAFEIAKYGDLKINESTGKAFFALPLHTYKAGQIEVPISISYIGNGVKINDPNTWTGVNWTLKAGGVITRTVYDDPDEWVSQRIYQSHIDALDYDLSNAHNEDANELFLYLNSLSNDTQPDIFNFSFLGYGGSFYLDENYTPVLINLDSNIIIEIIGTSNDNRSNLISTKKFKITTPDGTAYFFGGLEVETSLMEYSWRVNTQPIADTAYYLYRIEHPVNGNVIFEYDTDDYIVNVSMMHGAQKYLRNLGEGGSTLPSSGITLRSPENRLPSAAPSIIRNSIDNGKFLSRIYSTSNFNQEVKFNSTSTINGGRNFNRVLESIEIKTDDTVAQTINFSYIFNTDNNIGQRFFLENIKFNRGGVVNPSKNEQYTFEYYQPENIPKRFSYAQDHYGYYNGADSNQGLMPTTSYSINSLGDNANRSFNFDKSLYGTLQKIIYPTGGNTTFTYENALKKKNTTITQNLLVSRNNYPIDDNGAYLNDNLVDMIELSPGLEFVDVDNGDVTSVSSTALLYSQNIVLMVNLYSLVQVTNHNDKITVKITNFTDNQVTEQDILFPNNGSMDPNLNYSVPITHFFDKDKSYRIELSVADNSNGPKIMSTLSFSYVDGVEAVNGGGLRVKYLHDQADSGSDDLNIKRYYYIPKEFVLKDPFEYVPYFEEPQYTKPVSLLYEYQMSEINNPEFSCGVEAHPGMKLESQPVNYNEEILNNYPNITISYGGDEFENGGLEMKFQIENGGVVSPIKEPRLVTEEYNSAMKTHAGAGWMFPHNGKLISETVLIKRSDTLFKIKETENLYLNTTVDNFFGIVGSIFEDCGPGPGLPYSNVGLGRYEIRSKVTAMKQTKKTEFIDPFPVAWKDDLTPQGNPYIFHGWTFQDHDNDGIFNENDQDYLDLINAYGNIEESDYRKMVKTTNYEYNSTFYSQPTKVVHSSSEENKTYETQYHYLDALGNFTDIDANNLNFYQALASQNRVDLPFQTDTYINRNGLLNLISKQRTEYDDYNGLILPSIIKTAKGATALEERVVFVNYSNGFPSEIRYKDGSITRYLYNGYNQVIRKIENYGGIDPNPIQGNTDCETHQSTYMGAHVTSYSYDPVSLMIKEIIDPRCNSITYHYDQSYRLKWVKDSEGNILSENDYNYKPQNQN